MKRRVGVDIDGVLYDWMGSFRFLANHYLGTNLPPVDEMWTDVKSDNDFLTKEQQLWLWTEGVKKGLFRLGHLHTGSAEALREISEFMEIVIITHRPNSWHIEVPEESRRAIISDTLTWLALLDLSISSVHVLSSMEPKSSVYCDAYVDDSPKVIDDLVRNSAPGSLVMLWDRPWNRGVPANTAVSGAGGEVAVFAPPAGSLLKPWAEGERVPIRVRSWSQAVTLLRGIA